MVTPIEKENLGEALLIPSLISADGDRVTFGGGFMGDAPSLGGVNNPYLAERDESGWGFSTGFFRPAAQNAGGASPTGEDHLPDLSAALWNAQTAAQRDTGESQFFLASRTKQWTARSSVLTLQPDPVGMADVAGYRGGSADLSRFVFSRAGGASATTAVHSRYLADDPVPLAGGLASRRGWPNLYLVAGGDSPTPSLQLVNRDTNGTVIGPRCGAILGGANSSNGTVSGSSARHAVSADGKTIFFTARPTAVEPARSYCTPAAGGGNTAAPARVFARRDGLAITQVSQSQCARTAPDPVCSTANDVDDQFEGASVNGQRVFFTTTRQLTNSDRDTTKDLYAYDFDPPAGQPNLVQVSQGDGSPGSTAGNGAVVQGVVRLADDGSRAYVVAHGRLTATPNARGEVASTGAKNLYVWQRDAQHSQGRVAFVAPLDAADAGLWAVRDERAAHATPNSGTDGSGHAIGGDGRFLVFASAAALTEDAPGDAVDVFRYDDGTQRLRLVSRRSADATGDAGAPANLVQQFNLTSKASYANLGRTMSEDGAVVAFTTDRALVAEDVNDSTDVYQWRDDGDDGVVSLITDGVHVSPEFQVTAWGTMSPGGRDLIFLSGAGLLPEDSDGGPDVYNARIDGGFPYEEPPVDEPCAGDACQGPPSPEPPAPFAGSVSFAGPGNGTPPAGPPAESVKPTVSKLKTVRGTSAKVRVKVPGKGKIQISGSGFSRVAKSADKAGTYTIQVRLTQRARATLKRKGQVKLRLTVGFAPAAGASSTVRVPVGFKSATRKASSRVVQSSDARKGR